MKKLILIFFYANLCLGQVVYESFNSSIYDYLSRLSAKGLIELNDLIKPIDRMTLARKLYLINEKKHHLTELEKRNLEFYWNEFGYELSKIDTNKSKRFLMASNKEISSWNLLRPNVHNAFRIIEYSDDKFYFRGLPKTGFEYRKMLGHKQRDYWFGASFESYFSDWLGLQLDFAVHNLKGYRGKDEYEFNKGTGIIPLDDGAKIEYVTTDASLNFDFDWAKISLTKDHINWGNAESGNIVLSEKAPSFLFARIDLNFTDWFRMNIIHGWLESDVLDSGSVYKTKIDWRNRAETRKKYIISRSYIFNPLKNIEFALGESIIFSDSYNAYYLLPLVVFKLVDQNLSKGWNARGNNTQLFFNLNVRSLIPQSEFYFTGFIDELSLGGLIDDRKSRDQYGYSIGIKSYDLLLENLSIVLEYTRINPFVYDHYIPTQTYQNSSFNMGHWMGNNSDLFYVKLGYEFFRGLRIKFYRQFIRKGEKGESTQQYSRPNPEFLFGLNKNYTYHGFDLHYELFTRLNFKLNYLFLDKEFETESGSLIKKKEEIFKFQVSVGF